ncbi:MAG: hypothetical protein HKN47_12055, partial [Pirellulaceae bacterium]|nr:hypothetical protein [Pirellulaceae bacterium]
MNEVKRALVFWPAITSAIIIVISIISPSDDETWRSLSARLTAQWSSLIAGDGPDPYLAETEAFQPGLTAKRVDQTVLQFDTPELLTEKAAISHIESAVAQSLQRGSELGLDSEVMHHAVMMPEMHNRAVDRTEHGSRAMQLPTRVAEVFRTRQSGLDTQTTNQPSLTAPQQSHHNEPIASEIWPGRELIDGVVALSNQLLPPQDKSSGARVTPIMAEAQQFVSEALSKRQILWPSDHDDRGQNVDVQNMQTIASQHASSPSGSVAHGADSLSREPVIAIEMPAIDEPSVLDSPTIADAVPQPAEERHSVLPRSIAVLAKVLPRHSEAAK